MTEKLVIIGAGGFAREASLLVEEINENGSGEKRWQLLGFIDEDEAKWGLNHRGYPVLGGWSALEAMPADVKVICVVGEPAAKKKLVAKALQEGRQFAALIHPDVSLGRDLKVGQGVVINKGVLLTVDIAIGDHVSINPGCGIGHDAEIGAYTTLMWRVNISGNVTVEEGCLIGTGATILQGRTIGAWSTVGAGAVVTSDLPSHCIALGIPAKVRSGEH